MKTIIAIVISMLTFSCSLLEEIPKDCCTEHSCNGMDQLSLVQRHRLIERSGIPWRVWVDGKISVSMALKLKQRYELSNAEFTEDRKYEP